MIFVGFFGSTLAAMAFESIGPDLPNEVYGLAVAGANEMFTDYRTVTVGAGLYSSDDLLSVARHMDATGLQDQGP